MPFSSSQSMIRFLNSAVGSPSNSPELTAIPSPVRASSSPPGCPVARDDLDDRQIEGFRELPVPLVVGGNGHDGAGSVGDQDVVGDPDGNLPTVHRIDRECAGEDAGLGLWRDRSARDRDFIRVCTMIPLDVRTLPGGRDLIDQRMLRGEHHVGGAEQRVGPGGVDLELTRSAFQRKYARSPLRSCRSSCAGGP